MKGPAASSANIFSHGVSFLSFFFFKFGFLELPGPFIRKAKEKRKEVNRARIKLHLLVHRSQRNFGDVNVNNLPYCIVLKNVY